MNWHRYIGKKVSILITGKDDKEENYMGIIREITDDGFMVLDTNYKNFTIDEIMFKVTLIKSVWIYKKDAIDSISDSL